MKKAYIFLDIDGTLYSQSTAEVPLTAKTAIQMARINGSKVFLCTGRSLAECGQYLDYDVDGFVFAAGTMIYIDQKRIFDHPFSKEDENLVKQIIEENDLGYAAEGQAGAYCDKKGLLSVEKYFKTEGEEEWAGKERMRLNGFYPDYYEHEDEKIYKICAYGEQNHDYAALRKSIPTRFNLTYTVNKEEIGTCVEVTDARFTKASGIQQILEHYGVDPSEAIGIGDSLNDLPMIEYCGIGVAMGNAMQELKDHADLVTTDILDDGIYNAFKLTGVI